jgi:predicted nucleic acid-binding protein
LLVNFWEIYTSLRSVATALRPNGFAPDLIIPETCNTAWKKVRRGDISREQGEAMVRALPLSFDRLAPTAVGARPRAVRALPRP